MKNKFHLTTTAFLFLLGRNFLEGDEEIKSQVIQRTPSLNRNYETLLAEKTQENSNQEARNAKRARYQKFVKPRPDESNPNFKIQKQEELKSTIEAKNLENRQKAQSLKMQMDRNHPNYRFWFSKDFFQSHHFQPSYYNSKSNWWRHPEWVEIIEWLPWKWQNPIFYDQTGYPIDLPIDVNSYIPIESQPPQKTDLYSAFGNWYPLGVFAVNQTGFQNPASHLYIQLAINKEGDISGTFYNAITDQTFPVDGIVDGDTQQAIIRLYDSPHSPIATTGLFNLTQDFAEVQIQFPAGPVQNWTFIRLNP